MTTRPLAGRVLTADEKKVLAEFSRRPWQAKFHGIVPNATAPGGAVEMFILLDDATGEQMVSIAVPRGHGYIADWIAGCCARPWFVREQAEGETMTAIAIALNRALKPFFGADGMIDGRDVALAAITIMTGYIGDLPKDARDELTQRLITGLKDLTQETDR